MTETVGSLVQTLVVIVMVTAVLDMLVPQQHFRRYLRLVIGMLVLLMIVNALAALLGRESRYSTLIIPHTGLEHEALLQEGENLREKNQQAILEEYRLRLTGYLEETLASEGWRLLELELELEEDFTSEDLGRLKKVEALVYPLREAGAEEVDPVEIPPVSLKGSGEKGGREEAEEEKEEETSPELEKVLSSSLGISPEKVEVRIASTG